MKAIRKETDIGGPGIVTTQSNVNIKKLGSDLIKSINSTLKLSSRSFATDRNRAQKNLHKLLGFVAAS